jgi:D-ribose pyranose/furanose isomerase RbsD
MTGRPRFRHNNSGRSFGRETQLSNETKKMRVMKKTVLPEFETYSRADSHQYFSIVHNHVLRIAARGGLINLTHFQVGQYGQICLSKEVIERAELFDKHQTYRKVIEAYLASRIGTHQIRFGTLLLDHGLTVQGHPSLMTLVHGLQGDKLMTLGNLADELQKVDEETREAVLKLKELARTVAQEEQMAMSEERLRETNTITKQLYVRHGTQELTSATKMALTGFSSGNPRLAITSFFRSIASKHELLAQDREMLRKDATVPFYPCAPEALADVLLEDFETSYGSDQGGWVAEV